MRVCDQDVRKRQETALGYIEKSLDYKIIEMYSVSIL